MNLRPLLNAATSDGSAYGALIRLLEAIVNALGVIFNVVQHSPVVFVKSVALSNVADLTAFTVANDGVTLVKGDRVLLPRQTTGSQNGIYVVGIVATGTAPLTRASDFNTSDKFQSGIVVVVQRGTVGANTNWQAVIPATFALGTDTPLFPAYIVPSNTATVADAASTTITPAQGYWRHSGTTLSQGTTYRLSAVGASTGDLWLITRESVSAQTLTILDDTSAASLAIFPASKSGSGIFQFNGTAWFLKEVGGGTT